MKALVTGGLGFIGSNLVDMLKDKKYDVVVLDDLSSGKEEHMRDDTEYVFGDIKYALSDKVTVEKYFKNIDIIFHLAAESRIQPSFDMPLYTCHNNAYGTAVVADFARENNCKVVYAGSSSFYGGVYLNPYAFTKWQGEEVLKMYSKVYGVSVGIARFFNVYGPRNPLIGQYTPVVAIFEEQMKSKSPLTVIGDGEQRRDFTHVFDICEGLITISKDNWQGEIFNLGTGTNHSINELANLFGGKIKYLPARSGEARATKADISFTTAMTGWVPKHTLEKYIENLKL